MAEPLDQDWQRGTYICDRLAVEIGTCYVLSAILIGLSWSPGSSGYWVRFLRASVLVMLNVWLEAPYIAVPLGTEQPGNG